jgi:thioredoxin-related protein
MEFSKLLFCVIFVFFSKTIFAQTIINFEESGYQSILNRSQIEKKPILYIIYATWCQHCNKMKAEVLSDATVANFINKNFICVWQDYEKGDGKMLQKKYKIKSFPAFLFLDENENYLYGLNGEYRIPLFLDELQSALNPIKQLPFLKQEFLNEPNNSAKCLSFLSTLKKGKPRTNLNEYAHQYLSTQTDDKLVTEINWKIISNGVTDIKSREFQFVLQHQNEFAAITSPKRVEKKLFNIVTELLQPLTENLDSIQYKKERLTAKSINNVKIDSLVFRFDMLFYERTSNYKSYKNAAFENVEKFIYDDTNTIKEIGQIYLKKINIVDDLNMAIKWNLHALLLKESFDGLLLVSKLYLKIKNKDLAIYFGIKAKEMIKNMGWNSKEADEYFKELKIN